LTSNAAIGGENERGGPRRVTSGVQAGSGVGGKLPRIDLTSDQPNSSKKAANRAYSQRMYQ
jgi:hypothetical protein